MMNTYEKLKWRDEVRHRAREILGSSRLTSVQLARALKKEFPEVSSSGVGVMLSSNCSGFFERDGKYWKANATPSLTWDEREAAAAIQREYTTGPDSYSAISLDAPFGDSNLTLQDCLFDPDQSGEVIARY